MGQPDNQNLLQHHKPAAAQRAAAGQQATGVLPEPAVSTSSLISSFQPRPALKNLGTTKQAIDYLRRIDINFRAFRLRPGRDFRERKLWRRESSLHCPGHGTGPDGTLKGKFRIPAKTPAGIKADRVQRQGFGRLCHFRGRRHSGGDHPAPRPEHLQAYHNHNHRDHGHLRRAGARG